MNNLFRQAAGDDEGDEWASDVRNVDGTVRGSYHKAQAAARELYTYPPPSLSLDSAANPNVYKPPRGNAWGQSNTLADKLKNEKKMADLKANDPAILSTTLMPSSAVRCRSRHGDVMTCGCSDHHVRAQE